jgi:hypothetical protein
VNGFAVSNFRRRRDCTSVEAGRIATGDVRTGALRVARLVEIVYMYPPWQQGIRRRLGTFIVVEQDSLEIWTSALSAFSWVRPFRTCTPRSIRNGFQANLKVAKALSSYSVINLGASLRSPKSTT